MPLASIAEDYFSQMNPMASRIYADINETKSAYEDLWGTLSENEQKQILSESIIPPEVAIQYKEPSEEQNEEFAVKFILDDHCSYRDEHSGPFSFKTPSQRDLRLFAIAEEKQAQPKPVLKYKAKVKVPKIEDFIPDESIAEIAQDEEDQGSLPKTGLDFLDNW